MSEEYPAVNGTAYSIGREARKANRPLLANPYPRHTLAWEKYRNGWMDEDWKLINANGKKPNPNG